MGIQKLIELANQIDELNLINDQIEVALEKGDIHEVAKLSAKSNRLLAAVAPYGSGE